MTNLTETPTVSATRVLDVAHSVAAQLGDWAYHPELNITAHTHLVDGPHVHLSLSGRSVTHGEQAGFLEDLAAVLDTIVHVTPSWIGTSATNDYRGTGVSVQAQARIGEVRS